MAGEADGYYNQQPEQRGYAMQQGQGQEQQQQQYSQPPPDYRQNYTPHGFDNGEKPSYDQAFKIEGPKWNDIWAGLLFLAVCAGFVVVSGISIQGYGESVFFWIDVQCFADHDQPRRKDSMEVGFTAVATTSASTPILWSSSSSVWSLRWS